MCEQCRCELSGVCTYHTWWNFVENTTVILRKSTGYMDMQFDVCSDALSQAMAHALKLCFHFLILIGLAWTSVQKRDTVLLPPIVLYLVTYGFMVVRL